MDPRAVALCERVDALVDIVAELGDDAMHALMCVNHHAYALLEGGDAAALQEAVANLAELAAGVGPVAELVDAASAL